MEKDNPKSGDHHSSICFKKHGVPGKKKDDSQRGREKYKKSEDDSRTRHASPERRSQGGNRYRSRSPVKKEARDEQNREHDPEKEAMKKRIQELEERLKQSSKEDNKNI
jgi:hypothetical protein